MNENHSAFGFDLPTSWRHGIGMAGKVNEVMKDLGCRKALLLTDDLLVENNVVDPIINSLKDAAIEYTICGDVTQEPTVKMFDALVAKLDLESFDSIIAVGGGSVLDVSKGLALIATFGGHISDYAGFNNVPGVPKQKIIAIPTTSGTGSEVSDGVVLIDEEKETKFLVISKKICPTVALTDPELTCSMPPRVTVCSGIDALVHATESYISNRASVVTEIFALKAIEYLCAGFKPALANGQDLKARESMQLGATMAMTAGMNSYLGLCHAMAMPLCALYHMPHGQACGMSLPTVLQFNAKVANGKVIKALKTMGLYDPETGDDATSDQVYDLLKGFLSDIGILSNLTKYNYTEKDNPQIIQATLQSAQAPTNPRTPSEQDMADLIFKLK